MSIARNILRIFTTAFSAIIFASLVMLWVETVLRLTTDLYSWFMWVRYRQSLIIVQWESCPGADHMFRPWYDRSVSRPQIMSMFLTPCTVLPKIKPRNIN